MMQQMQKTQGQQGGMQHGAGQPDQTQSDNPVIRAYAQANQRMHHAMALLLTGDADQDFLRGMIPHHQGAIDMAQVVLAHGKDARVKKLAREIIAAQQKEIAMMQTRLGQPAAKPSKAGKAEKAAQKKAAAPAPMAMPEAAPAETPAPPNHVTH